MAEYNFSTLSPADFESLVGDLLRAQHGWKLENFGYGPDGGVDLRATVDGRLVVVQCKHYHGSKFSNLRSAAREEAEKMIQVHPGRYLFATSQNLSLTQKDTLRADLGGWISCSTDILCMRDINSLIDSNRSVEQKHFKLWLASVGILQQIVNSGVWERSEALMEEIQDRVKLYVSTNSYSQAFRKLLDSHVVVLTGAPGVGKSMLADMLSLTLWEKDWQVVNLPSHQIDKCWDVWQADTKQLFYFDDVFGQTDINERLSRDAGSTLARIMHRVQARSNKLLVITTRTHVFRQAAAHDEPLAQSGLSAREFVVQVSDYSVFHRAKILYNHIYFSSLERDIIRQFVRNGAHLKVVRHPNFNPRTIEQILMRQSHSSSVVLEQHFLAALDRPMELWGPSFTEALSEAARRILLHLASFPVSGAPIDDLRVVAGGALTPTDYTRGLKSLEGTWIAIERRSARDQLGRKGTAVPAPDEVTLVSFANPSCRDFVLAFLDLESDYVSGILERIVDLNEATMLLGYCIAAELDVDVAVEALMRRLHDPGQGPGPLFPMRMTYRGLNSWAMRSRRQVAGHLMRICATYDAEALAMPAETLHTLSRLDSAFGLGIQDWIDATVLELGALGKLDASDPDAMHYLLDDFLERNRAPGNQRESMGFAAAYRAWVSAITGYDDWEDAKGFIAKVLNDSERFGGFEAKANAAFNDAYFAWISSELKNALDEAHSLESAEEEVEYLERQAEMFYGANAFRTEIMGARQTIHEMFCAYEPVEEDLEHIRLTSQGLAADSNPPSGTAITENEDLKKVETMFRQLL